eukprot:m51a1_g2779 hypothetical protein (69) ;mRNA; f:1065621-1068784
MATMVRPREVLEAGDAKVVEATLELPGVAVNAKNCHTASAKAVALLLLLEASTDARASPTILCKLEKR